MFSRRTQNRRDGGIEEALYVVLGATEVFSHRLGTCAKASGLEAYENMAASRIDTHRHDFKPQLVVTSCDVYCLFFFWLKYI